ncbi:Got1/Sft2-like family-domain-containing protein [Lipomyces arxii]|uniref:Got1/Sft2-like family-domain-containing protein n=1 Tax=Lipomyces arxii TaxID=56418 RepID=UPI0034CFEB1D
MAASKNAKAAPTAESSFRSQLSSFSSRPAFGTAPPPAQPTIQLSDFSFNSIQNKFSSVNPFKSASGGGYIQLPISENGNTSNSSTQEPSWFTMSRWDRIVCFGICFLAAVVLFILCFALFPVLALRPRKFALLWTFASVLFVISFGCLQGPVNYIVHLTSLERLPFTVAYFGSIIMTLVFSMGMRSNWLTIIACVVQIVAALWYTVSYFPLGTQGLRVASRFGIRRVNNWLES